MFSSNRGRPGYRPGFQFLSINTGMPLPAQGNLVADWNTDSLPVVADGTSVSSWVDSINGQSLATGLGAPTYKVNRYGGHPSLLFNGSQSLIGAATQSIAAINSGEWTMMVVYGAPQATTYGFLASATDSTGINIANTGTNSGSLLQYVPNANTGFNTGMQSQTKTYAFGTNQSQIYVNGSLIYNYGGTTAGTPSQIGVGATRTGIGGVKAEILRVLIWNKKLTVAESIQAERAERDYYSQSYPWTTQGYYYLAMGDSITFGLFTTLRTKPYPYLIAQSQSMPLGSWGNLGESSATPQAIKNIAVAENVNGISAITGVPTKYSYMEFYNTRSTATSPIASSSAVTNTQAVLAQLKATAGDKVLFWDTLDYANRGAEKGLWTGYWNTPANRTGYADAYIQVSANTNVGVDNASPNSAPYGPYFANTNNSVIINATTTNGSSQLTVNSITSGTVQVGDYLVNPTLGLPTGTYIASFASGTGAAGSVCNLAVYGSGAAQTAGTGAGTGSISFNLGDGIHPSDAGHAIIAPLLASTLSSM